MKATSTRLTLIVGVAVAILFGLAVFLELRDARPEMPSVTAAGVAGTGTGSLTTLSTINVTLEPVASGFDQPTTITHAGDGSNRLFVVERTGQIRIVTADGTLLPTPFLNIRSLVNSGAVERGLLGLAFHPDYPQNGHFYVHYTAANGDVTIARYTVSADPNVADATSAVVLLRVPHPFGTHNGGQLAFGPDGYLYVGIGDGDGALVVRAR